MVVQDLNFNLGRITHEEYLGSDKKVAPLFKELSGLSSKILLSDEKY